jgi:ABC-type multidrug transport system ATPase subunit
MTGLALDEAYVGYKGTDVLRGISASVEPGQCVAVLGPNGAGK